MPSSDEEGGPLAVEGEKIKSLPQSFASQNPAPSSEGAIHVGYAVFAENMLETAQSVGDDAHIVPQKEAS